MLGKSLLPIFDFVGRHAYVESLAFLGKVFCMLNLSCLCRCLLGGFPLLAATLLTGLGCSSNLSGPDENTSASNGSENRQAQQAVAGVGKRGQSLEKHTDAQKLISGPATTQFKVEQKMILEVQIPHALQLFRGEHGRLPESHEEFMTKIVQANQLSLPELPEGMVYRFNTAEGTLWVYPEDEAPPDA
jgi:hypothetical protein